MEGAKKAGEGGTDEAKEGRVSDGTGWACGRAEVCSDGGGGSRAWAYACGFSKPARESSIGWKAVPVPGTGGRESDTAGGGGGRASSAFSSHSSSIVAKVGFFGVLWGSSGGLVLSEREVRGRDSSR